MRYHPRIRRHAQHLALTAAVSALAAAGLVVGTTKPALAEFEIQESQIEKGEVELEYRGAVHWGLPEHGQTGAVGGGEDEDVFGAALDEEVSEVPLRQSHDFEFEMGVTDWWLIAATLGTEQPVGEEFEVTSVELETQFELIERKDDGIGLAVQAGYGAATVNEEANEIEFGPIVELASGPVLLTLNPLFSDQVGEFAETESLGFEYGWRGEYDFNKRWGVGVEMFGEIEDLANAGSFDEQNHSIGPTLFLNLGGDDDDEGEGEEGEANGGDDDGDAKVSGPAPSEVSMNIGLQFGLTEVTSDVALKFQGSLGF